MTTDPNAIPTIDPLDGRPLYFLHIPKTAGTSFRAWMSDHVSQDAQCPHWLLPEMLRIPPWELRRYRLFAGHGSYMLAQLGLGDLHCVTMLRDPIARSISSYLHLKHVDGWLSDFMKDRSFESFVDSPVGEAEMLSFQTRHLAFDDIQRDYFGYQTLRNDIRALRNRLESPELLAIAKDRLHSFAFVGLQERFVDSMRLLAYTCGWPEPAPSPRRFNTARFSLNRDEIPDRTMRRLQEINAFDSELVELGARLFEQRMSRLTPDLFESRYREVMSALPRTAEVHLGFEAGIRGTNWLPRENQPSGTVRWTGPGATATLDLPLPTERTLRLSFRAGVWDPGILRETRVRLNGHDVPLTFCYCDDVKKSEGVFRGVLTPDALRESPEYARLEFSVPRTVRPSEIDPKHADHRELGLYMFWLDISPGTT